MPSGRFVLDTVGAPPPVVVFGVGQGFPSRLGCRRFRPAGPPLGVLAPAYQLGSFHHLQMLGDGRQGYVQGPGQLAPPVASPLLSRASIAKRSPSTVPSIVVVGGAGLIGKKLVNNLRQRGRTDGSRRSQRALFRHRRERQESDARRQSTSRADAFCGLAPPLRSREVGPYRRRRSTSRLPIDGCAPARGQGRYVRSTGR